MAGPAPPHRAVQHRSPRPGIEARSYLSGRAFPRHSHDQLGIGVMLAGAQRSWSCRGEVESRPGDLVMVNPGEMHDGLPFADAPRSWHTIYFDPDLVAQELAGEDLSATEIAPTATDPAMAAHVLRLVARLSGPAEPLAVEEGALVVLVEAVRRHGLARRRRMPALAGIDRARARIDAAPEAPVTLAELAEDARASRFQLIRGFVREVGATPHAYLVQSRLRLARRLLAAGEAPAEVALRAGFADQSHLTRAFARQFGVTPGRYRAALSIIPPSVRRLAGKNDATSME